MLTAGRRIRHDPRAIASLFGWLDRQMLVAPLDPVRGAPSRQDDWAHRNEVRAAGLAMNVEDVADEQLAPTRGRGTDARLEQRGGSRLAIGGASSPRVEPEPSSALETQTRTTPSPFGTVDESRSLLSHVSRSTVSPWRLLAHRGFPVSEDCRGAGSGRSVRPASAPARPSEVLDREHHDRARSASTEVVAGCAEGRRLRGRDVAWRRRGHSRSASVSR